MADYYPLLVRAIAGLAQNTGETRKVVFDRARAALLKQLRSVEPPLPEGEIGRERQALEDAIRRIEAENKTETPEPEEPPVRVTREPPPRPAPPKPSEPAPTPPQQAEPVAVDPEDLGGEDETPASTARRPTVGRGHVGGRHERPRIAKGSDEPKAPRWQKTVLLVFLIGVLIAGGAYAVVNRDSLFGQGQRQTATAPTAPAATDAPKSADQPKSTDRVTQAGGGDTRAPVAPPRAASSTTQRAYLFEDAGGSAQSVQTYEGTVTWKTETFNAGPGLPPDVGIRADLQIPGRMSVSFTLRRNADQALPASHTIEISFTLPQDFAYGSITNVPGVLMKQTEGAQGAPLAGLSVRVNPTYFLVGLSAVPADKERNIQLLQTRPWIGFPMAYANNKRAAIAFEKGTPGDQAFQDAFSAWGELLPPQPPPPMPATPGGG
ncbi:hypothetical protein ABLE91_10230 [Aquabacter sp. CN5-332]|uniref:hypothetical protein n=1 Tax=Aquabacter sp. CN5-332 TaxID=3156608 RepID=UPI0032B31BA9